MVVASELGDGFNLSGYTAMAVRHPWTTWWEADLPCQFSPKQADGNAAFLEELVGRRWITQGISNPGRRNHPLLREWSSNGAGAFLQLNALAEDLRLVVGVPGIESVIDDLKNVSRCLPTWHVIRSAAMFARGGGASIVQFFPQTSERLPDFEIIIDGKDLAVEAKLLLTSEIQDEFSAYAERLEERLFATVLSGETIHPPVYVVLKDVHGLPGIDAVVAAIAEALSISRGDYIELRSQPFNVFLDPPPQQRADVSAYASCVILCPRSEKENFRVEGRSKNASNQLKAYTEGAHPGIFCLGVTEHQDPHFVCELLQRRFSQSQNKAISGVILSRSGTHLGQPQRTVVDFLVTVTNVNALAPLPERIPIAPLGMSAHLLRAFPRTDEVSAYRFATALMKAPPSGASLFLPDIRVLTKDLLR